MEYNRSVTIFSCFFLVIKRRSKITLAFVTGLSLANEHCKTQATNTSRYFLLYLFNQNFNVPEFTYKFRQFLNFFTFQTVKFINANNQ